MHPAEIMFLQNVPDDFINELIENVHKFEKWSKCYENITLGGGGRPN